MIKTDVLIVGGGPAGSVCGYLLQKAGVECMVIDRATFPRDKLCGGGLTPKSWRLLEELIPGFTYEYNSIRKMRLVVNGSHSCDFPLEPEKEIRIVKRKVFDNALLNRFIDAGGKFVKDGFLKYEEGSDRIVVTLRSGEQVECRYLVGADGANSRVRNQLAGRRGKGLLVLEQYMEPSPDNAIECELSNKYDVRGYFYRFPNGDFDAVGYGDESVTPARFREILRDKGITETRMRGCYVYMKNDYPINDHVILIGDAGGFANRVTSEGIKGAFVTARNAAEAIRTGRPFREVNDAIFKKMEWEEKFCNVFYSRGVLWVLGVLCRFPNFVKKKFEERI